MSKAVLLAAVLVAVVTASAPKTMWSAQIEKHEMIGYPAFARGQVYIAAQHSAGYSNIYCFDETSGDLLWTQSRQGKGIYVVASDDGKVFHATDKYVYANDGATITWQISATQFKTNGTAFTTPKPDYVDGTVLLSLYNGPVVALDAATGSVRYQTRDAGVSRVFHATVGGNRVFFYIELDAALGIKFLVSRNLKDGSLVWRQGRGAVASSVYFLVANDYGIVTQEVPSPGGLQVLASVDPATGQTRWRHYAKYLNDKDFNMDADRMYSIVENTNATYNLMRFATDSGAPVWTESVATADGTINMMASSDTLFLLGAAEGFVWAYDGVTGNALWQYNVTNPFFGSTRGNTVVFGSNGDLITALRIR